MPVPSPDEKGGGLGRGTSNPPPIKPRTAKLPNEKPRKRTEKQLRRQKQRKRTMIIGTWNVQGLSNKISEVIKSLNQIKADIIILSETKKKGHGQQHFGDYTLIWNGVNKNERAKAGVAILIKTKYYKYVKNIEYVTERCLTIKLLLLGRETTIIALYAPTDDAPDQIKTAFYDTLEKQIQITPKRQHLIIAGDLNARIGSRVNDEVVGPYGERTTNDSGERLIELCKQNRLRICNSFFKHKNIHMYTWERPTLNQKSIIDYVITEQDTTLKILDTRVKRGPNCRSDHYIVISKIYFPFTSIQKTVEHTHTNQRNQETKRFQLHLLHQESIRNLYIQRLEQQLRIKPETTNIEEEHQRITQAIIKAAEEAIGYEDSKQKNKNKNNPIWSTEIENVIRKKNEAYQKWLTSKNPENLQDYRRKKYIVKNTIKKETNTLWEAKCNEIDNMIGGTKSTEAWKLIKNMRSNHHKDRINLITLEENVKHYNELLTESRQQYTSQESANTENNDTHWECNMEDLEKCIKTLKNNKSPGPGNIPAELIKTAGNTLYDRINKLFNKCIRTNMIPEQWKIAHLTPIFKKGDKKNPNNYRGLCMNSTMSKLFSKIVKSRLEKEATNIISEEQSGFTAGRSCIDNLFTVQQLLEKRTERGLETHLAFIDLEKAYDSVPRIELWKKMKILGINCNTINLIKTIYSKNQTCIKQGSQLSKTIETTKGLRQGCPLSPTLFNIYLEGTLHEWKRKSRGMGIPIGESHLYTLNFADDQIIFAQDAFDLEYMLRKLYDCYELSGLTINIKKTEYMAINSSAKFNILINDQDEIKQVEEYKYLGTSVTATDGINIKNVKHRIEQGRKALGALNSVWWSKNISKNTKKHIGKSIVESITLYGCEIWSLSAEMKRRVNALEMDYLRRSMGVSRRERVRNEEVRRTMEARETITDRIEIRSLKWFGHLMRMDETRWPYKLLKWTAPGNRKRGRPRRSWNEGIRQAMESRGLTDDMTADRESWRLGTDRRL